MIYLLPRSSNVCAYVLPSVQRPIVGRLPRGIGVTRLRDAPVEWSRQHAMLGSDLQAIVRFLHAAQRFFEIALDQPIATGSARQPHALEVLR